jgi:hypothetical protein
MYNVPSPVTAYQISLESAVTVSAGLRLGTHSKRITFCPKTQPTALPLSAVFLALAGETPDPFLGLPPKPALPKQKRSHAPERSKA